VKNKYAGKVCASSQYKFACSAEEREGQEQETRAACRLSRRSHLDCKRITYKSTTRFQKKLAGLNRLVRHATYQYYYTHHPNPRTNTLLPSFLYLRLLLSLRILTIPATRLAVLVVPTLEEREKEMLEQDGRRQREGSSERVRQSSRGL